VPEYIDDEFHGEQNGDDEVHEEEVVVHRGVLLRKHLPSCPSQNVNKNIET